MRLIFLPLVFVGLQILGGDAAVIQVVPLAGASFKAQTIETVDDPMKLSWEDGKAQGKLPMAELIGLGFAGQVEETAPRQFARRIYPGDWQAPASYAKDGAGSIGSSTVSRFEVAAVEHEGKGTIALFEGILHVPVSGSWTFRAVAADRLGLAVDGAAVLAPDTAEMTAEVKLEAGAHQILVSVPSARVRIYEIMLEGPGYGGPLADLLLAGPPSWLVAMQDGSLLRGTLTGFEDKHLVLTSSLGTLNLPWDQMTSIRPENGQIPETEAKGSDVLWVANGGRLVELRARFLRMEGGSLIVDHDGQERKLAIGKVAAMFRPPAAAPAATRIELADGQVLLGKLTAISKLGALAVATSWHAADPILVKSGATRTVLMRPAGCAYLAELDPQTVEQRAWFDYPRPWRRNSGFNGAPARGGDETFSTAVALHAFTRLVYPAATTARRFLATVAIEDGVPELASAQIRVLAGSVELANLPALTVAGGSKLIDGIVPAGQQLVLEVDFGANEDIGDQVIFGNARLVQQGGAN